MVEAMQKYVMPPRFDFLTYKKIKPITMYIFEFEHTLSREDLLNIWQNLSPNIGRNFEHKEVSISHDLANGELLSELEDELRWMVFKVKRKASSNYYEMLAKSVQEEGFSFDFVRRKSKSKDRVNFDYTYNWPYDYFSLIELAKMDASVEIEGGSTQPENPPGSEIDKEIEELAKGDVSTTESERRRLAAEQAEREAAEAAEVVADTSTLEAEDPDDVLTGTGRTDIPTPGGGGFGGGFGGSGY